MSVFPVISVSNYQTSKQFYTEKLGFHEDFTMDMADAEGKQHTFGIFSMGKGTALMLGLNPVTGERGAGVDLMLYPDDDFDIDAYYTQLKSRGVEIRAEIKTEYWGDRVFSLQDPDGYTITFGKVIEQVPPEVAMERLKQASST